MKKTNGTYSRYFLIFLREFGLHGVQEYERLTKKEKDTTDRAYLKDLPYLIKKHGNKNTATE